MCDPTIVVQDLFYVDDDDDDGGGDDDGDANFSSGVFLVTYITLVCIKSVRRRVPLNFICLFIFVSRDDDDDVNDDDGDGGDDDDDGVSNGCGDVGIIIICIDFCST